MPQRPSPAFMLSHPAHLVALGFGSGLSPKAPGTIGSLWGWLSWLVLSPFFTAAGQGAVILLAVLLGWWACKRTVDQLDIADPGFIVWDEIVAIWLVLWLVASSKPFRCAPRRATSNRWFGCISNTRGQSTYFGRNTSTCQPDEFRVS